MEGRELGLIEDGQHPLELGRPQTGDLGDDPSSLGGQIALDDAPVLGAVVALDQAVALDALDETGGSGGRQIEHLGHAPHRLRAMTMEQDEEPQLPERQVKGRERRSRRRGREHAHDIAGDDVELGRLGGLDAAIRCFTHP